MYVCVWMYVVCICMHLSIGMGNLWIKVSVLVSICPGVCIYMGIRIYVYMYICMDLWIFMCMYVGVQV